MSRCECGIMLAADESVWFIVVRRKMELWKICRAVNNAVRLDMLRVISQSPCCALNVLQTGDFVRLQKAASSQYLKQLAAAGFLAVERNGRYVVCSCSDAPGTCAGEIYGALKTVFPKSSKTNYQ